MDETTTMSLRQTGRPERQPGRAARTDHEDNRVPEIWRHLDRAERLATLDAVWKYHTDGRVRFCAQTQAEGQIALVSREETSPSALVDTESRVLQRVFCGETQKVLALELGLASSTVSHRYNRALAKLKINRREAPTTLVLAAQSAAGLTSQVSARSATFANRSGRWHVVWIPVPQTDQIDDLTSTEQQVASWVIEGRNRSEISRIRGTSVHTASHQIHSIFATLRLAGRYALIRRAAELACFFDPNLTRAPPPVASVIYSRNAAGEPSNELRSVVDMPSHIAPPR